MVDLAIVMGQFTGGHWENHVLMVNFPLPRLIFVERPAASGWDSLEITTGRLDPI
jgi:hypothetical protein